MERSLEILWSEYNQGEQRNQEPLKSTPPVFDPTRKVGRDSYTELMTLYFDSARFLLNCVLERRNGMTLSQISTRNLCDSILQNIEYIDSTRVGCAYIRIAFPAAAVAKYSPCPHQSEHAKSIFVKWQAEGIMGGLSDVTLKTIRREQSVIHN